jgi:SAM-dependent methyltransferase
MSKWSDYYKNRNTFTYLGYFTKRYATFLQKIENHIAPKDQVLELGCGMGTVSAILRGRKRFSFFYGLDNDPDMLELAKANMGHNYMHQCDALLKWPGSPKVVHSHGVLEHWSDNQIKRFLSVQAASGASWGFHYVPSDKYLTRSFGDERLLSTAKWHCIAKPTHIQTFNGGFDLILCYDLRGTK